MLRVMSFFVALGSGLATAFLARHAMFLHNTERGKEVDVIFWMTIFFLVFIFSVVHSKSKRCKCKA